MAEQNTIKKIGVLTSGGDAPGMNPAIRSVVRTAFYHDITVMGIYRGYDGLLNKEIKELTVSDVGGIINRGGTVLLTARCEEMYEEEGQKKAGEILKEFEIDALVVIGGDGSYKGALAIHEHSGIPMIGIPGTIDNDIPGTDFTIGFATAVNTALDAIDKIRDTATSHERLFVVEVMGRQAGYIALETAIAGGAEAVLMPEVPFDLDVICARIEAGSKRGKLSSIVVVAEGAASSMEVAYRIKQTLNVDTRLTVIGHMQRGGSPVALDRILAARFGKAGVDLLLEGERGAKMIGVIGGKISVNDLADTSAYVHKIDPEIVELARILAI